MSTHHRNSQFKTLATIGNTAVYQIKGSPSHSPFFYTTGMKIDMDGAPNCYAPYGVQGALDYLGNAGHPGNWWGIATDSHKKPIIQNGEAPAQPYKGFYVSVTALICGFYTVGDVRRYTDATKVPYIALPHRHVGHFGMRVGDLVLIVNALTGTYCYAVFADTKNEPDLSECSCRAAAILGVPSGRSGGTSSGIVYIGFPGSGRGQGFIPTESELSDNGPMLLRWFAQTIDKESQLIRAYPDYPFFASALIRAGYTPQLAQRAGVSAAYA
jgi:hypothetical protein